MQARTIRFSVFSYVVVVILVDGAVDRAVAREVVLAVDFGHFGDG